ncbi:MAG TPA: zinc-binding alcohol dehydrogenase [Thermohalobaculum sp.]|nr:zinc-binding alcohol dehydrogenase [Thermohalobaculum sp.]
MTETAQALFYVGPGAAELRSVALPALGPGMAEVRTLYSGLSRGTERLVSAGAVPTGEYARMRAPLQEGDFPFPVKYGYAAVGVVEAGPPDLLGRHVFCLHPHQDRFRVGVEWLAPLPDGLPPERAILGANAETALNAIWDAALQPGERVLVLGAGLLGCLIAAILSKIHEAVDITDKLADPGVALADFPVNFLLSPVARQDYDVVFHSTASAEGLQAALDALAFEGRVIELSWFGDRPVPLMLGGAFHARRLSIRASQVGHVAQARRATTSRPQRLAEALALLTDPRLDRLITGEVAFADLPHQIPRLLAPAAPGIATRIRYP